MMYQVRYLSHQRNQNLCKIVSKQNILNKNKGPCLIKKVQKSFLIANSTHNYPVFVLI